MTTATFILGLAAIALLVFAMNRLDAIFRDYQAMKISKREAQEVHTVAMMTATMMSGMLANSKQREELIEAIDARDAMQGDIFSREMSAMREDQPPDSEELKTLRNIEEIKRQSVRNLNVFDHLTRRKIVDLAWSTYYETRNRKKSWPGEWW